jgi:hypothetical protein
LRISLILDPFGNLRTFFLWLLTSRRQFSLLFFLESDQRIKFYSASHLLQRSGTCRAVYACLDEMRHTESLHLKRQVNFPEQKKYSGAQDDSLAANDTVFMWLSYCASFSLLSASFWSEFHISDAASMCSCETAMLLEALLLMVCSQG